MKKNIRKTPSKISPAPAQSPGQSGPASGSRARTELVSAAITSLWQDLFTSPVHLDSALAKRNPSIKSILAQVVPRILIRPASEAESMGIGIPEGEPWSLQGEKLSHWRPAQILGERIYESMVRPSQRAHPMREDFPPRMTKEWDREWGPEITSELIHTLGLEPPLSLRSARSFGPESVLRELTTGSRLPVSAKVSDLTPSGVRLSGYAPILSTPIYGEGAFEIQDEGSQVMALFAIWPEIFGKLLQPFPGPVSEAVLKDGAPAFPNETPVLTVIDACAGAGGKTLALADALRGKGRVYSYDTSISKLQALKRRASRAGLRNIQAVQVQEGREDEVIARFRSTAQVVLVDAPCTGWGVLRRNPDIKWRQTDEAMERMPAIQLRLLSGYASLVAPGGRLVFGVCTFRRAETTGIVEQFLAAHPEFVLGPGGYLGPGPCDGFFMQSFARRRKGDA